MERIIVVATIVSIGLILISYMLTHKRAYPRKISILMGGAGGGNNIEEESRSQYECGIELFEEKKETREKFYIKFYIIAIIFLIFDLESILLYPASILFTRLLKGAGKGSMETEDVGLEIYKNGVGWEQEMLIGYVTLLIFMYLLIIGIYYELKKEII